MEQVVLAWQPAAELCRRVAALSAVLAPTETGQAWRTAVLEDIPDPRLALGVVRGRLPLQDVSRVGAVGELRRDESRGPVLCPGRWGER